MIKKNTLSKKTKTITDNNNGARTVIAVFLVSNLSTKGPPINSPIIEKKPSKIYPFPSISNDQPF